MFSGGWVICHPILGLSVPPLPPPPPMSLTHTPNHSRRMYHSYISPSAPQVHPKRWCVLRLNLWTCRLLSIPKKLWRRVFHLISFFTFDAHVTVYSIRWYAVRNQDQLKGLFHLFETARVYSHHSMKPNWLLTCAIM